VTSNGEEHEARGDAPDADQLERQWEHALDSASAAVNDSGRAGAMTRDDASEASRHIEGQRKWLRSFKPTLRKLFPGRRRGGEPPAAS
jgi:hypothetical protein